MLTNQIKNPPFLFGRTRNSFCWLLIIGLLFLTPSYSNAQLTSAADSLQNLLSRTDDNSERARLLNELSKNLLDIDPTKSLNYAKEALRLAQISKNKEQEIDALQNIGIRIYDSKNNRDSALAYFIKGEQMAEEFEFKKLQSDHLMRLANYYRYHKRDSSKTVQHLLKSIEVSKTINYHFGTGRSYAKLASFYTRYKQVQLCKEYLNHAASYYSKIDDGQIEIAHYYDEVGNKIWDYNPKAAMDLYFTGLKYSNDYPNLKVSLAKAYLAIEEPHEALKYLNESLAKLETIQYPRIEGIATAKLADVYMQLEDYPSALNACDKGINLLSTVSISTQTALPALYRTKGDLMVIEKNDQKALEFYLKSLEEAKKTKEYFEALKSNISLGTYYSTKNSQKGIKYCKIALEGSKRDNYTSLEIDACNCLYHIHKKEKQFAEALKYFEYKNQLRDSISTLKVEHALDINNQIAEKDKELAEESFINDIKEEKLKNQYEITQILFFSSLIGLFLIGFLSLGLRRIKKQNVEITKKTNELVNANVKLARSNEELERFAHVASHDLKSPLNTMIGFAGLIRKKLSTDVADSTKKYIDYIEKSGKRMSTLIDDILEYSKLSNQDSSTNEVISLNELVDEISSLTHNSANGRSVTIEASELPVIKWNYSKIFLLFKNFIENGLKYNDSENPYVKIYSSNSNGNYFIHFEDNGIGIKPEYFDKIFMMFNRLHGQEKYDGTGLGLATCKKIIDDFKGKIEVSSAINEGTTFKIEIPNELISTHSKA